MLHCCPVSSGIILKNIASINYVVEMEKKVFYTHRETYMGDDDFSGILLMAFKTKKCPTIN
jgi:hypothetical protein